MEQSGTRGASQPAAGTAATEQCKQQSSSSSYSLCRLQQGSLTRRGTGLACRSPCEDYGAGGAGADPPSSLWPLSLERHTTLIFHSENEDVSTPAA